MSMDPPPSRTPIRPIRPDGEIPDSPDTEQQLSDSEDLLEATPRTVPPSPEPTTNTKAKHPRQPVPYITPLSLPTTAAHALLVTEPPLPTPITTANHQAHPSTTEVQSTPPSPALSPAPNPKNVRLQTQIADLQSKISDMQSQLNASNAKLAQPERADVIVKAHIKLLHDYNAIKDVGLGLMGLIADGRGVRLGSVMEEFGVGEKD